MSDIYNVYSSDVHDKMHELDHAFVQLDMAFRLHDHVKAYGVDDTFLRLYNPELLGSTFHISIPSCESLTNNIEFDNALVAGLEGFISNICRKIGNIFKSIGHSLAKALAYLFDYLRYTKLKLEEYREDLDDSMSVNTAEYSGYKIKDSIKALNVISARDVTTTVDKMSAIIDTYLAGVPDLNVLNTQLRVFSSMVSNYHRNVKALPRFSTCVLDIDKKGLGNVIDTTYQYVCSMLDLEDQLSELDNKLDCVFEMWFYNEDVTTDYEGNISVTRSYNGDYVRISMSFERTIEMFEIVLSDHANKAVKSVLNMCEAGLKK